MPALGSFQLQQLSMVLYTPAGPGSVSVYGPEPLVLPELLRLPSPQHALLQLGQPPSSLSSSTEGYPSTPVGSSSSSRTCSSSVAARAPVATPAAVPQSGNDGGFTDDQCMTPRGVMLPRVPVTCPGAPKAPSPSAPAPGPCVPLSPLPATWALTTPCNDAWWAAPLADCHLIAQSLGTPPEAPPADPTTPPADPYDIAAAA